MCKFDQNRIKDGWEKLWTNKPTDTKKIMVTWPWTKNTQCPEKSDTTFLPLTQRRRRLLLLLHLFNSLFSRTTWVSRHQKGKQLWILLLQEMMGWQWHQLNHMQIICTSLKTDNHASTSSLSFYRLVALPATQPTASKHWRQFVKLN